jgi:photosystem II stability/assembly factor-like uncharacterized protein
VAGVQFLFRDGVYRSNDGGNSWTQVLSGAPGTSVLFDPTTGDIAYAALYGKGVYSSRDAGATWTPLNGSAGQALPSANSGRIVLASAASNPTTLYAGIANAVSGGLLGFFVTRDAGTHWTQLTATPDYCDPQCFYDHTIAVDPTNANVVYAGGAASRTLVRSLDGGATWSVLQPDGFGGVHPDLHALAFSSDGSKLYLGTDGGAWSSTDILSAQVNFTQLNDTLAITQFYPGISVGPGTVPLAFGGTQDNGTQRYTGSEVWNNVACGDGGSTAIGLTAPTTVYTTCAPFQVLKSTSSGDFTSWFVAENGINFLDPHLFLVPLAIDPSNPQTLYLGTDRVYQTTDGAGLWQPISPHFAFGPLTTIAVAPSDSNIVYAVSSDRTIVTTNAGAGFGAVWTNRSTGLAPRSITQVAVDPTDSMTAYVTFSGFSGFVDTQGHIFKTVNGGENWTDISGDLPNIPVNDIAIDPDSRGTLFVATDVGVFYTPDGGVNWRSLVNGLPRVAVLGLKLHEATATLWAATHGRSMWQVQVGPQKLAGTITGKTQSASGLTVALQLINSSLENAESVSINNIALRTLSGSGTVTVAGLALPVAVGSLAAAASTTVTLVLNVPSTVSKFSISESGTLQNALGNVYNFAIGQVVYPAR